MIIQNETIKVTPNQLFNKIWKNIVIRNVIFTQLHLINVNYNTRIYTIKQLQSTEKNNIYINSIYVEINKIDQIKQLVDCLPVNLTNLKLHIKSKESSTQFQQIPTLISALPNSIKISLVFHYGSRVVENDSSFPSNLISIGFSYTFQTLNKDTFLPYGLKKLNIAINDEFHKDLSLNSIPSTVSQLFIQPNSIISKSNINSLLTKSNLVKLTIGTNIELDFNCLPVTLKYLELYSNPRFKIQPNTLSNSNIEILKLNNEYCFPLQENTLPTTLEYLQFYFWNCKEPICNVNTFPSNLKSLLLGRNSPCIEILDNSFPPSLTYLELPKHYKFQIGPNTLPKSNLLQTLILPVEIGSTIKLLSNSLPHSITNLTLNSNVQIEHGSNSLPKSLTTLNIQTINKNDEIVYPTSLQEIVITKSSRDTPIHSYKLPSTIKTLTLSNEFNIPFTSNDIPDHIEHISFGRLFNQQIVKNSLPDTLKSISFNSEYNQPFIKSSIPDSVNSIYFKSFITPGMSDIKESEFTQILTSDCLPSNLKLLYIGYSKPTIKSIPSSVECIIINSKNFKFFNINSNFLKLNINLLKVVK